LFTGHSVRRSYRHKRKSVPEASEPEERVERAQQLATRASWRRKKRRGPEKNEQAKPEEEREKRGPDQWRDF